MLHLMPSVPPHQTIRDIVLIVNLNQKIKISSAGFSCTSLTEAVKLYPVSLCYMVCKLFNFPVQFFINRHLQIDNRSAPLAYKMVMRVGVCVIPIKCAPEVDLSRQSLLDQYVEITIHGSRTQSGKFFLEPVVYPYRCRMRIRTLQQFENSYPLFAFLVFFSQL